MPTPIRELPQRPRNAECQNAYWILRSAHGAVSSFLELFASTRKQRGAKGTATDEEQDLLRAMLTFATAGLDSMVTNLIRDALPAVIKGDVGATGNFKTYIARRLRKDDGIDRDLLAEVLGDQSPRDRLINELIRELTSESLQSSGQVDKAASFFDIPSHQIYEDRESLNRVFRARNQIALKWMSILSSPIEIDEVANAIR